MVNQGQFFRRLRSYLYGLTLPYYALKLIFKNPKLLFWSILPIAITLWVYFTVIPIVTSGTQTWITEQLVSQGLRSGHWLYTAIQWLASIMIWILGILLFSIVSSLIASPFNDLLSEATEPYSRPAFPPTPQYSWRTAWRKKVEVLGIDLMKTGAALIGAITALLLSWLPVINLIAFAIAFLLVTYQYVSYPQTRREVGVRQGLVFLWRHAYACLGLGTSLSFLFSLPLLATVALPIAVVSGTLLAGRAPGSVELRLPALK